jgi:hypothetical protein
MTSDGDLARVVSIFSATEVSDLVRAAACLIAGM